MSLNNFADVLMRQTWQIAFVFGLVWVVSLLLRNASAHWRYMLWLLVIAKCVTPPILNIPVIMPKFGSEVVSRFDASPPVGDKPIKSEIGETGFRTRGNFELPRVQSAEQVVSVWEPDMAARRFQPGNWLVAGWLLITATMLTFVAGRFWATNRRLKRSGTPADDETQKLVELLAKKLGLTHPPRVYSSAGIAQPFVWGVVCGDIYVPQNFARYGTIGQRQAVLTHEMAHVARYDAALNTVQILVQTLFFFHPLVWWANSKIRHEREKCCDETALSLTRAEPEQYCNAIIEILASGSRQRSWSPVLAMTGSKQNIDDRILTILTPGRTFRSHPSRGAIAITILIGTCLLPTGIVLTSRSQTVAAADPPAQKNAEAKADPKADGKSAAVSASSTWAPGQTMEFRAINARTKQPLADVMLELQNMGPGIDFQDVKTQTTDADGLSIIKFPDLPAKEVRIYPSKSGYVPLRVFWDGEPFAILPKTLTLPMEPGKEFGATILNKAGKPIPGVTVTVHYWAPGSGKNPHIRANIFEKTKTDAEGRWRLNIMPAEIVAREMRIYVSHPDYLSDYLPRGFLPFPVITQPPLEKLYDQTAVMMMADGEIVEGKVVAADTGLPLVDAKVYLTDLPPDDVPRTTSNKEGNFKITGISRTTEHGMTRNSNYPLALIVQAAGRAPELVEVKKSSGPIEIRMNSAKSVQGKVVDEAGAPVEGARIAAEEWRGRRSQLSLQVKSAADGTFTIPDAPPDVVKYSVYKEGYLYAEGLEMLPSKEYSITLKPPVQIVGSVMDAETGKPLEKFSVMPGIDFDDGRPAFWSHFERKSIRTGSYLIEIRQENFKYRIRAEAEGYAPAESRLIKPYDPDKGKITIDFKLHRASNLVGTVEGRDKKPLADAEVFLVRERMNLDYRKITYISAADGVSIKTDASGRFEFPAEVEKFCIVAIHKDGLGMITREQFAASPTISVQPWDKYKDRLQIIPQPAEGTHVDFPPQ